MPSTSYDDGRPTVTFRLPPEAGAQRAWVVGEFNAWSLDAEPLRRDAAGALVATVPLEPGTYRFRYYLGDGEWENDWAADAYVDNEHGGQDSVVVVPPPPAPPPPVGDAPAGPRSDDQAAATTKPRPAKKAAARAGEAAAGAVNKAGAKKAAAKRSAKKAPPG